MDETFRPVKKPSGCLSFLGWLLTIGSILFIALCIAMIFEGEKHMDELRAEYAASQEEYEKAMEVYNADSTHLQQEYQRIQAMIDKAEEAGDTALVQALTDSLSLYAEPVYQRRGAIGFNIAGAFFIVFALCACVPLLIGVILLFYYHRRKQKYKQQTKII